MKDDLEKVKYNVLGYLAKKDLKGAVDYVRGAAPMLGLTGAMKFVKKVQAEAEPNPRPVCSLKTKKSV